MEEPPKNALQVKIMEPLLNAGLFRAHIYPYGSVPDETRQFIRLTNEMKKESVKFKRLPSIPKENEFVAVYSLECNDWFRGYIVRMDYTNNGLLAKVFLIDYGAFLRDIPYHCIHALPFKYSVNVLDSQAFKIALFGVNPRGIKIGVKHCSFVRQTHWLPSHTLFISNVLKNACKIYFHKVCRRDEIHFGYIFVQQNDKWISLQDILVREDLADAGDSELEFINKEIPRLMKRYRLTGEFDNMTSVRRKLYPNLPVDDTSDISNLENSSIINHSDEDNIAVSSKTPLSGYGSVRNGYEESVNSNAESSSVAFSESGCLMNGRTYNGVPCSDISSNGEQSVVQRNKEDEAFSENSSKSEIPFAETAAVFNVNDPTLNPVDTDHHVDNIFMLGHDDEHYFCAASQFSNLYLDSTTLEVLDRLKVRDLTQCQKYMIPAMLTGKNITLIDSPKSGKTSAYLISLISLLRMKNNDPTEFGISPRSVIVCPYSSRCESIHDECWSIISGHKEFPGDTEQFGVRANLAYGCGSKLERDKLIELSKGYDVLVCTPRCLLRLIKNEKNEFNLNKMSHIVFDEFHILLEAYFNEVADILQYVNSLKKKPVQRIIISNLWNLRMKDLVEKDVLSRTGFVLIPCYLEAALFVHIVSELKYFSNEEKKVGDIFHLVNNQTRGKSVVIVLDVDDDVEVVYSKLNKCGRFVSKIKDLQVLEREHAQCFKKQIAAGHDPVLICTDYTLRSVRIYEADCLIHYSLPKSKSVFNFRFSVLLNSLQVAANEVLTRKKSAMNLIKKPETYIYINTSNQVQFPLVLDIMKKLHANVPEDIETLVKRVSVVKEIESKKNVDFCVNLRQFGRCVNEKLCEFRHVLTVEKDIPDPLLPKSGEVQVHITHVYSPTYFRVRLLKHKTENGEWIDVRTPDPSVLTLKLNNYLRNPDNVRAFEYNEETQNDIVAVHLPMGSGTYSYERAKILKIVESREINKITGETKPKTVRIRCVDSGVETVINISNIVKLPPHLMSIAEATVDAFVCNLLPVDEDNTWGIIFRQLIDKKIQECAIDKKNKFIGTVKLVIGRSMWLDPFGCYRYFDYLKEHYLRFSVSKYLLKDKLAVKSEYHLENLFDKCKEAGLEIDNEFALTKMVERVSISEQNIPPEINGVRDTDTAARLDVPNDDLTKNADGLNSGTKNEGEHLFRKPMTPVKKRVTSQKNCITKPMTFWKQDDDNIYLTIMENIDENYVCTWEDKRISFEGRMGSKIYKFDEYLYACIDCEKVSHRKSGVTIVIKLPKLVKTILWRRLLKNREPQKWIKVDPNIISSDESDVDYSEIPEKYFSGPVSSPPRNYINKYKYPDGYQSELTSDVESDTDSKLFEW